MVFPSGVTSAAAAVTMVLAAGFLGLPAHADPQLPASVTGDDRGTDH